MNVLIAAATRGEIEMVMQFLEKHNFCLNDHQFEIVITGIGGIATTYNLHKALNRKRPQYLLQAGIAGTFNNKQPPGAIVCVTEEIIADQGVEENNEFRDAFDLGLLGENDPPFSRKYLKNPFLSDLNTFGLPKVRGISINEITTRKDRIELFKSKFNADIESMEGAAFHYVCLCENIPFIQIRGISNYVGERNKENWRIALAIENLNNAVIAAMHQL